jgi:hypothetical protein
MIITKDLVGEEWAEWYFMTSMGRWQESSKLWETYLALDGSLNPKALSSKAKQQTRALLMG